MARDRPTIAVAPRARRDVQEIWGYIAAENPSAAERVVEAIDAAILRIGAFPEQAAHRAFYNARILPVLPYPYLIAYRIRDDAVEIMRVVDGRRNLPTLLGDLI